MHSAETVVLKLRSPGKAKQAWLDQTAELFRQGTQLGLDAALRMATNNTEQSHFRCVACGYQGNADVVASFNIAGVAAGLLHQGSPDTTRSEQPLQLGFAGDWVDGVKA